jgi:hypothetical protein
VIQFGFFQKINDNMSPYWEIALEKAIWKLWDDLKESCFEETRTE